MTISSHALTGGEGLTRCFWGRMGKSYRYGRDEPACPRWTVPGSVWCSEHRLEALVRIGGRG